MRCFRPWLLVLTVLSLAGCGQSAQPPAGQSPAAAVQTADNASSAPTAPRTFQKVRPAAVAGMFYPGDKDALAKTVDGLLAAAKAVPIQNVRALVCPHAGYEYSGKTAAIAFKQLSGRDIRTVIVLAPSHTADFTGAALPDVDGLETPLGIVPVSTRTKNLAALSPFAIDPSAQVMEPGWMGQSPSKPKKPYSPHTWEHSLEVQLPFIQRVLPQAEVVPVILGQVDPQAVARVLADQLDDKTLLVASSDLSHYHPYDEAKRKDDSCVKAVCELDVERMAEQEACGRSPILVLMHLARQKHWQTKLLDLCNSGDTAGDRSRVVGYAAIAFYEPEGAAPAESKPLGRQFSPETRSFLLKLAREAATKAVNRAVPPAVDAGKLDPLLKEKRACFVTLTKKGDLRGCIGSIFPQESLVENVIHNAQNAATKDWRFLPVEPPELNEIEFEVSVLTVPQSLAFHSPEDLVEKLRPKIDGVVLRMGRNESTFLPQVWEQLPEKEMFLNHLARKAGSPPTAWRDPGTEVLTYQAEAFKESDK